MEVLLLAIVVASNILCFCIGARVGQKVIKGESIEMPNPMKAIREHQARAEAKKEQTRLDTIMQNIDNYDGTGYGQKDVPRG